MPFFSGSILSLVKANHVDSDSRKPRRQLYGYSVSSKRYAIYEKLGHDDIKVVEPKAHGLGYLAAPKVVAGEDIKQDILKTGIRKLERETGVSHHTLEKILGDEPVRRKTLAKIAKQIHLYRIDPAKDSGTGQGW